MDIVSVLDKTFFMGDGRALLRGVSKQIGEPVGTLGAPGGTRMFVFFRLSLLKNFKPVVTAMHARLAWKQQKHGARSLRNLMDVGRRLTDVSFVVFLSFLENFMPVAFEAFSKVAQKAVEPSILQARAERSLQYARRASRSIDRLKTYVTVATLLRQHCSSKQIMQFLAALCYTPAGRSLPKFLPGIMKIIHVLPPEFSSVTLHTSREPSVEYYCLGPHCQCLGREKYSARHQPVVNLDGPHGTREA